jgi:hypothetical protein
VNSWSTQVDVVGGGAGRDNTRATSPVTSAPHTMAAFSDGDWDDGDWDDGDCEEDGAAAA